MAQAARTDGYGSARRDGRFFVRFAAALLVLNIAGFAPSFFLGHWFEAPELPLRTKVHGVIFTGWFVLLLIQTSLVSRSQLRLHRRLGTIGVALALTMAISALNILYHRALEYHSGEQTLEDTTAIVWSNLGLLLAFVVFVTLGFVRRNAGVEHKRFMTLASIAMMPQALGRIGYFPLTRILDGPANNFLYGIGGILVLLIAMAVHDRSTLGRIHRVTAFGGPGVVLLIVFGAAIAPRLPFGTLLIESLG